MDSKRSKMDNESLKEATLDWINFIRVNQGFDELSDIKKGKVCNAANCPVANSLPKVTAVGSSSYTLDDERVYRLPNFVSRFIKRFDYGSFPEYRDYY